MKNVVDGYIPTKWIKTFLIKYGFVDMISNQNRNCQNVNLCSHHAQRRPDKSYQIPRANCFSFLMWKGCVSQIHSPGQTVIPQYYKDLQENGLRKGKMEISWFITTVQPFTLHCCLFYNSWLRTKWLRWGSLTLQIPLTSCFQEWNWSWRKSYPIIWASDNFTAGTHQSIIKEFLMCLGIMGEMYGLLYELL